MNWDAIGAIGEIVGAIAVIATLFYLAAQIKHSTEATQAQRFQELVDGITNITNEIARKEHAGIVTKGFKDFYSLESSERITFDNLMFNLFNYAEAVIRNFESGMIDQHTMDNLSSWLRTRYLLYRGVQQWFDVTAEQFPPYMRDWITSAIAQTDSDSDIYGILATNDRGPKEDTENSNP